MNANFTFLLRFSRLPSLPSSSEDFKQALTVIKQFEIAAEEKNRLEQSIDKAASKVVNKLMFDLRENLNMDTWRECVEAIAKIYP